MIYVVYIVYNVQYIMYRISDVSTKKFHCVHAYIKTITYNLKVYAINDDMYLYEYMI